jgi:hypothetical protein
MKTIAMATPASSGRKARELNNLSNLSNDFFKGSFQHISYETGDACNGHGIIG